MLISREIVCGITYLQIVDVACKGLSFEDSASELGLYPSTLRKALKRHAMCHWFSGKRKKRTKSPLISPDTLATFAGMTKLDTAAALGVHRTTITATAKKYGLMEIFPDKGKAKQLSIKGYAI